MLVSLSHHRGIENSDLSWKLDQFKNVKPNNHKYTIRGFVSLFKSGKATWSHRMSGYMHWGDTDADFRNVDPFGVRPSTKSEKK